MLSVEILHLAGVDIVSFGWHFSEVMYPRQGIATYCTSQTYIMIVHKTIKNSIIEIKFNLAIWIIFIIDAWPVHCEDRG